MKKRKQTQSHIDTCILMCKLTCIVVYTNKKMGASGELMQQKFLFWFSITWKKNTSI